jgi:hypothetical protein
MTEDSRCCGSGTCIIDADGRCWCGQQWDGQKMCPPLPSNTLPAVGDGAAPGTRTADGNGERPAD